MNKVERKLIVRLLLFILFPLFSSNQTLELIFSLRLMRTFLGIKTWLFGFSYLFMKLKELSPGFNRFALNGYYLAIGRMTFCRNIECTRNEGNKKLDSCAM